MTAKYHRLKSMVRKPLSNQTGVGSIGCDKRWGKNLLLCKCILSITCTFHVLFYFSRDQAAPWMVHSVRPSVFHTFFTMFPSSYHEIFRIFFNNDGSEVHANGQGQGWKVKVLEVKTQFNSFRTITLVWIHIWWWNNAQSLMLLGEVPYSFSWSSVKF